MNSFMDPERYLEESIQQGYASLVAQQVCYNFSLFESKILYIFTIFLSPCFLSNTPNIPAIDIVILIDLFPCLVKQTQ